MESTKTIKPPVQKLTGLLSTGDVGKMLGVSPQTVGNWADSNRFPSRRFPGGHRKVDAADLRAYLVRVGYPIPPELA